MINLAVIEDNLDVRESLQDFFLRDKEIDLVLACSSIEDFLLDTGEDLDVVLLDLFLPGQNGKDAIPELMRRNPGMSIIVHSVADDYDTIFQCLCQGAHSYLTKGESLDKVKETILITVGGGSLMSVEIARKVVDYFQRSSQTGILPKEAELSIREKEIIDLIVSGRSYKMVADDLSLSINTVRKHIKSIYRKLNINTNVELVNLYLRKPGK